MRAMIVLLALSATFCMSSCGGGDNDCYVVNKNDLTVEVQWVEQVGNGEHVHHTDVHCHQDHGDHNGESR